jgi:MFS family permease
MGDKHFGLTVLATSLAFVLVQLDVSIINVALATIGARLDTGILGLQWVVDAYAVTFASLLLSAGGLGDRTGRGLCSWWGWPLLPWPRSFVAWRLVPAG